MPLLGHKLSCQTEALKQRAQRETSEEDERKGKKTAKAGGVKRTAQEEADDSERADRRNRGDDADVPLAGHNVDVSMTAGPVTVTPSPGTDKR